MNDGKEGVAMKTEFRRFRIVSAATLILIVIGWSMVINSGKAEAAIGSQQQILAPDAAGGDEFGYSVGICNDAVIVGARMKSQGETAYASGAAYVYNRTGMNTWGYSMQLYSTIENDHIGTSVATNGDYAIIGADGDDNAHGYNAGMAYVLVNYLIPIELTAPDGEAMDHFGGSVAIDGDYAIAGASAEGVGDIYYGAAYIFRRVNSTWGQWGRLCFHAFKKNKYCTAIE